MLNKYRSQSMSFAIVLVFMATVQDVSGQERLTYDQIASAAFQQEQPQVPQVESLPEPLPAPSTGDATRTTVGTKPNHPDKRGTINYDIYRDRRPFPVDPRKPCHICVQRRGSNHKLAKFHSRIRGFQGRPYQEVEPGGCLCGKKKQNIKHPNINVYWPTWFAGVPEEWFPIKSANKAANYNRFRLVDIYDHLGGFEISGYQRKDNGYCGPGRDRYGCLGESRFLQSQVFGVGFRPPGQPVERGGVSFP